MAIHIAKFMTCTRPWRPSEIVFVHPGHVVTVERADFETNTAEVHFGGMLRAGVTFPELLAHTRIAEPDEFQRTIKQCPRCHRLELEAGKWLPKPPCFSPRAGVVLVDETCPACDEPA